MTYQPPDMMPEKAFLQRLVHDLRGPSIALRDLPGWLRHDLADEGLPLSASTSQLLRLMEENAKQMDAIAAGLGAWIDAGRAPVSSERARDPAAILARLPEAARCRLCVHLPDLAIARSDLANMIAPLLQNAIRFHPKAAPSVMVSGHVSGDTWQLRVTDDGPGPGVAEPMALVPPLAKAVVGSQNPGPGFGLAIVARIAARYGARIRFSARDPGPGAEILITRDRRAQFETHSI